MVCKTRETTTASSYALVTSSDALVTGSFLLLVEMHLLLAAAQVKTRETTTPLGMVMILGRVVGTGTRTDVILPTATEVLLDPGPQAFAHSKKASIHSEDDF